MLRWLYFINERFNPLSYAAMIFVFLVAHYILYLNFTKQDVIFSAVSLLHLIPLVLATTLFFFKLRLLDEVKDLESDAIYHPDRPLPKGVLSKNEVIRTAFIIMVIEIALFSYYGFWAFFSALIAVGYSLIMYKEFFVKSWLRAHLTTYAATHTLVVVFLSLTIFASLFNNLILETFWILIYFSFSGWFLFNIFEFGRKTFAKSEEKEGVASYSKIFGKFGAVLLVLAMAVLSIIFIEKATFPLISNALFLFLIPIAIAGLTYSLSDRLLYAKVYRALTFLYIIFAYGVVAFLAGFKVF